MIMTDNRYSLRDPNSMLVSPAIVPPAKHPKSHTRTLERQLELFAAHSSQNNSLNLHTISKDKLKILSRE